MLKPSPLKHREEGHILLNEEAHQKAHEGEGENMPFWKEDKLYSPLDGSFYSFNFDDDLTNEERIKLQKDKARYSLFMGDREKPSDALKGLAYHEKTGFAEVEDLKKQWNEENEKRSGEAPQVSYEDWLRGKGYKSSKEIDRLKHKTNNDLLNKDIENQIKPQTDFAQLANYFSASSTFKGNEWSDLGLAVTYTDIGNRKELKISLPTLIGEKYKDGSSITDVHGNIYINGSVIGSGGKAEKDIEKKMLELHRILSLRKEKRGNLDKIVNKLFIDTDEKNITDGSYIEGDIIAKRDRSSNSNFDELLKDANSDKDKKNQLDLKLKTLNEDVLKDTGLEVYSRELDESWGFNKSRNLGLVLKFPNGVVNKITGETEYEKEFKTEAELKSWLGNNVSKDQIRKITENALITREETVGNKIEQFEKETEEAITPENLLKQYAKINGVKPSKIMGIGWNNYDQLIEKDIEAISKENGLSDGEKRLLLDKSTDYLVQAIKNGTEPSLQGFMKFAKSGTEFEVSDMTMGFGEDFDDKLLLDAFNVLNTEHKFFMMGNTNGSLKGKILDKKSQSYLESLLDGPNMSSIVNNEYDELLFEETNNKGEVVKTMATEEQVIEENQKSYDNAVELVDDAASEVELAINRAAKSGYNYEITFDDDNPNLPPKIKMWWDSEYHGQEDPNPKLKTEILEDVYSTLKSHTDARDNAGDEIVRLNKRLNNFRAQDKSDSEIEGMLAQGKLMDNEYWSVWSNRFGRGVDNVTHGTAALFGNDYSLEVLKTNNEAGQFEKSYEWEDARWYENFGMVAADQGANALYFIGTMGAGTSTLGVRGAMALASGGVGVMSAGQQRETLEAAIDAVPKAQEELEMNQDAFNAGHISYDQYVQTKKYLANKIAMGTMTDMQKWGSIAQHGFVEAGFTYAFGQFGSLNTANNVVKAFTNRAALNPTNAIMAYNGWRAAGEVVTGVTKGIVGEVAEESSIYLTTGGFDAVILDREWDVSQLDKVIRDAAIMSGGMNSTTLTYGAIMNHSVRKEMARNFDVGFKEIKAINKKYAAIEGSSKEAEAERKKVLFELSNKFKENAFNWSKAHVEAMGLSEKDTQALFENGRVLSSKYMEAEVKEGDNDNVINERLELHRQKLNKKQKGSGDTWINGVNDLRKAAEALKEKTDVKASEAAIYGDGTVDGGENVTKNRSKIQEEIKKDKDKAAAYNKEDAVGKLAMELEHINEKTTKSAVAEMKQNPKTRAWVEEQVFSERDENGNIVRGAAWRTPNTVQDQAGWKRRYNKKRITSKQKKLIDSYYNMLAPTHISGGGRHTVNFKTGEVNAKNVKAQIQKITGKELTIVESNDVDGLIERIDEAVEINRLTRDEATKLKNDVEGKRKTIQKGSNGFILDNQWFVVGKDEALENMGKKGEQKGEEGNFLQGVVWMHEMSHYLDNITRSDDQIIDRANRVHRYLGKDRIYKIASGEVIDNLAQMNIYDKDKSFEEQDYRAKDEYLRGVEEKLGSSRYASSYDEILKKGGSLRSRFITNQKYDLKTDRDAVFEMVANIDAFRNGDITKAVSTRLKNIEKWKQELSDLKSTPIKDLSESEIKRMTTLQGLIETQSSKDGTTQLSSKIENYINDFIKNKKGELITKEQYDRKLNVRRKGKVNLADLLTPENNTLNGSIRDLGTRMLGDNVSGFPISEFMNDVKNSLTQALVNFDPEQSNDLSGWLAQHILYKKPGIIDDFAKRRKAIDDAKDPNADEGTTLDTPEGTLIVAKMLDAALRGESVLDAVNKIVEDNYNELDLSKLNSYKDVKKLIKDGDGPFTEILKIVSEKFGINVEKIINNADLDITERTAAQTAIRKISARSTLIMLPEGFNSEGKATGLPPTLLNAVNPETGEKNLIYTKQEERLPTVKKRVGDKMATGTAAGPKVQKKNFIDNINELDYLNLFGITKVGVESRYRSEDKKVDRPIMALVTQIAMGVANQGVRIKADANGDFATSSKIKDGKSDLLFSLKTVLRDTSIERTAEFFRRSPDLMRNLRPGFGKQFSTNDIYSEVENLYKDLYTPGKLRAITAELVGLLNKYSDAVRNVKFTKKQSESAWNEFQNEFEQELMNNVLKAHGVNMSAKEVYLDPLNINTMRQSVHIFGDYLQGKVNKNTGELWTIEEVAELLYVLQNAYNGNAVLSLKNNMVVDQENGLVTETPESERIGKESGMRYQSYESRDDYFIHGVMPVKGMTEAIWEAAKARVKLRPQKAYSALAALGTGKTVNAETENLIKEDSKKAQEALELFYDMLLDPSQNYTPVDQAMFLVSNLSHMEAPIRRAATFSHVAEGITTPGHENYIPPGLDTPQNVAKWMKGKGIKNWEKVAEMSPNKRMPYRNKYTVVYEHVIPASDMAFRLGHYKSEGKFFDGFWDKYTVSIIPTAMDDRLKSQGLVAMSQPGFIFADPNSDQFGRYYGPLLYGFEEVVPVVSIFDGSRKGDAMIESARIIPRKKLKEIDDNKTLSTALTFSRKVNKPQGITVLDFDDTLATTKSGVRAKVPNPDGVPKPKRKVIFLAGGAGSGKGNVISKLNLEEQGFKIVNSDISLEWLKKNNGLPENMNDFTKEQRSTLGKLQHQARGIAKRKMTKYQGDGNGVVVDGTGGSIKSMQSLVDQFESDGYDVSMMFVETSLPVALERNAARKERSLLDKIVEKNHESVQGNKDGFKTMFGDRFMEVNTDNLSQEDAMPTKLTEQMNDFVSGYENRRLDAEEFANEGADILEQGGTFDFSEFNKVVEGETAPLFNKAMKLQDKFGNKDMFVLTARPAESAPAIFEFLKANGLNIPIENITGLANSTPEAKALWMADKVADGYNDFYFADDALQNVQAVQNMLDQFDVKSKVQQAKIKFSKSMSQNFNEILEGSTGIESIKQFSDAQARLRGQKTKYKSIIPASAQDFQGLLYNFLGKGKKGEADMAFFKKALIDPFARGINELNASRQAAANDFENLNKSFPDVKKKLNKNIEGLDYTYDQAMRVYLWNQSGFEVPGLSKRDLAALTSLIENNPEMKAYADAIGLISKKEDGYSQPKDYWLAESIASDLLSDGAIGDKRSDFLAEWKQNKDTIFSAENLNKIEAIYGSKFREALEDILYRMETGRNRPMGGGRLVNGFMNWTNNSVGAIMFLNLRSATLQTISAVNYVNWTDNNPAKAAAAFANQPQFWRDFSYIFNSDYLKQRRSGNQRGVNESELSEAVAGSDNKAKAAIAWLLKKGFTPTQIADSFAISMGGATFYRNRIKTYVKEGMTTEQAESKAFLDLQETTEVNQQSARPDMISQQQASPLGRLILAFQNTPMQYARIMNKATRDLANGRGDYRAHISKIAYYGFVQSVIFGALQSALYASLGDDDEEDFDRKKERILNQMVDSWLTGIGYGGKAIGTVKNTIMEYLKQRDKGFNSDHAYTLLTLLSFSPPIGSKLRKIYSSIQTEEFNRGVFTKRGFTLDNPIWSGVGNVIEGVTNVPLGRISNLMLQLDNAMDPAHKWWQRVALLLGQNTWDLGIKDPDIEAIKGEIKEEKKEASKEKQRIKKEQKKKEKEAEGIEKQKKEKKQGKELTCLVCKLPVVKGKKYCTIHEKKEQNKSGKKKQCRKYKSDGSRCKVKTSNKSGYCYYHD